MNGMENRNLKYFNCLLVLSPKYKYKYYDVMNGMSIEQHSIAYLQFVFA